MSREYYARYELERKRREALKRKQAAETAEKLLNKYQAQLEEMIAKGFRGYIPDEIARLEADLARIRQDLIDDRPIQARDASQRVGAYIGSLDVIANTAIAQYERAERLRSEQEKARAASRGRSLLDAYYEMVGEIEDVVVANLAAPALDDIHAQIERDGDTRFTESGLRKAVSDAVAEARSRAGAFKAAEEERRQRACLTSRIEDIDLLVRKANIEDADAAASFAARIDRIKLAMEVEHPDNADLEEAISSLGSDLEAQEVSEAARREAVKAIYRQLKSQEFTVERPKRFVSDGSDYVRIVARRPSGKQAICEIGSDGSIRYRFDKYEAMTCLKDIERFNVDLESIYSLSLSDERVLWSNPDRLTKDANRADNDNRRSL